MTYYEHLHNPGVDIELFRMERTALITPTTGFMKRIIIGVKDYVSLLHRFGKRLSGKNDFDIVHVATSGSLGFVKDILMLRKAKSIGLNDFTFPFWPCARNYRKQKLGMAFVETSIAIVG
ncbi:MAG: hypothetical protein L6U61_12250 [Bacteroidales bacterium]|nr:MAG: hypothetical protein L6U61_12250 [Bacteroidales bacterium]